MNKAVEKSVKMLKALEEVNSAFSAFSFAAAEANNAIQELSDELETCRNELCLKCGNYKNAHKGACDGCRWKDIA